MRFIFLNKFNKRGFTLIELIVAVAVLVILSLALLPMFQFGIKNIFNSGKNSTNQYTAHGQIEQGVADRDSVDGVVVTSTTGVAITLNFPAKDYNVDGRKVDANYNYSGNSKKMTTFTTN